MASLSMLPQDSPSSPRQDIGSSEPMAAVDSIEMPLPSSGPLGARGRGLHTCPQAAWIDYHSTIRSVLAIDDQEAIVCGIALGYEDESERVNQLRTERAPVEEWTNFLGFE